MVSRTSGESGDGRRPMEDEGVYFVPQMRGGKNFDTNSPRNVQWAEELDTVTETGKVIDGLDQHGAR
jgi:hypothetical protein